ncbi:elongation factor 1-delta isoform X2 [Arctopsyche grandis]|uniref:elongation factor 1-delta isoform X2 n=1 Tax=Arctopsyche grandis TaxID=121162 RepID=UPI00406D9F30
MASPMVFEKFWSDKSAHADAERRHYESLAKCADAMEVKDKKNVVAKEPTPPKTAAPEVVVPEKTSRRRRRNKGSVGHSESSNKGDSISEAPPQCIEEVVVAPPVKDIVQPKPKETKDKPKQDKKHKNKNDKSNIKSEEVVKAEEVVKTEEVCEVQSNLPKMDSVLANVPNTEVTSKFNSIVTEVSQLSSALNDLRSLVLSLKSEVEQLKKAQNVPAAAPAKAAASKPAPVPAPKDEPDDGVDLFASDSEDEEAAKIKEERLAAYAAKKSKKPVLIAKSNIILDCKPWDDETDMKAMEAQVRKITADGLLWGASKCVPLAYGIQKLQISCVVEDEKISIDWLQEEIEKIEELVQSCDIAAFNKV